MISGIYSKMENSYAEEMIKYMVKYKTIGEIWVKGKQEFFVLFFQLFYWF